MGIYLERLDPRRSEGNTWIEDGNRYSIEKLTRREAIGPECEMLFELMRMLAKRYGDDCVRLVVWFDNYS